MTRNPLKGKGGIKKTFSAVLNGKHENERYAAKAAEKEKIMNNKIRTRNIPYYQIDIILIKDNTQFVFSPQKFWDILEAKNFILKALLNAKLKMRKNKTDMWENGIYAFKFVRKVETVSHIDRREPIGIINAGYFNGER